jgi:hypothetical protein
MNTDYARDKALHTTGNNFIACKNKIILLECDAMLFGGKVPGFQGSISTHLPVSRVKKPRKQIKIFTTKKTPNCTNSTNCCIKGNF